MPVRSELMHLLFLGWAIFVIAMLTMYHEVRCPRCGKRFHAKGVELWQIATECLHRGLPKYADVNTGGTSSDSPK